MIYSDWISIFALAFSIVSFILVFRSNTISRKSALRPVLVFVADSSWHLQNIGKGPALNITVAKRKDSGVWYDPVRVPPMSENGDLELIWWGLNDANEVGVTYEDFQGNVYTSTCKNDLSQTFGDRRLPVWKEEEVQRHWRYSALSEGSANIEPGG